MPGSVDNPEVPLPVTVRMAVGFVGLVLAAWVLRFSFHTMIAAWLVFPAPLLNPNPPRAQDPLALLERAQRHVPGEAHYPFMLGQLQLQRMRAQWLEPAAVGHGREAGSSVDRALLLLSENPYYHRLAGSVAIDLARHPSTPEDEARRLCDVALSHMQSALVRSPSSPLLNQQVGLELLKVWHILGDQGKDAARQALNLASFWDPERLDTSLAAVWARSPRLETLPLLDAVAPDTTEAQARLGRFLVNEAERFASTDGQFSEALGHRALQAHRRAVELADLDIQYLEPWILAHERVLPGRPEPFLVAARELSEAYPQRAEAHLSLAHALAGAARPEEAMRAAVRAVSLSAALLVEQLGTTTSESPTGLERSLIRRAWGLEGEEARILRSQVEVYSRALRFEADLLLDRGSYEPAFDRYRRLDELVSDDPYPSVQMGRCLDALGRSDEALDMYRAAVRRAPRSRSARSTLARAYLARREYLEAINEWRILAARNPRSTATRVEIARAYLEMGLLDEAVRAYSEALEVDPDNEAVRREMETVVGRLQDAQSYRD